MEKEKNAKKGTGIIIALAVAILVGIVVLVIALASVLGEGGSGKNDVAGYETTEPVSGDTQEDTLNLGIDNDSTGGISDAVNNPSDSGNYAVNVNPATQPGGNAPTQNSGANNVQAGDAVVVTTTEKGEDYDPVSEYAELDKEGDNVLSDHHDNKYIKAVSSKFGADTEKLVAVYSVPDKGENYVLEFDGTKDANGNITKSPDTLSKVYRIDEKGNIEVATGKTSGNIGVSYAEGVLCIEMIKKFVMPQYPDYFTGV